MVIFDAEDMTSPQGYTIGSKVTREIFGPQDDSTVAPDNPEALDTYFQTLYQRSNTENGVRATAIQNNRTKLDYTAVAEGPRKPGGIGQERDRLLAFRMLDDDTVPVVITDSKGPTPAAALLRQLKDNPEGAGRLLRQIQPYIVALPKRSMLDPAIRALCTPVIGDLCEWNGDYNANYGIDTSTTNEEEVW